MQATTTAATVTRELDEYAKLIIALGGALVEEHRGDGCRRYLSGTHRGNLVCATHGVKLI